MVHPTTFRQILVAYLLAVELCLASITSTVGSNTSTASPPNRQAIFAHCLHLHRQSTKAITQSRHTIAAHFIGSIEISTTEWHRALLFECEANCMQIYANEGECKLRTCDNGNGLKFDSSEKCFCVDSAIRSSECLPLCNTDDKIHSRTHCQCHHPWVGEQCNECANHADGHYSLCNCTKDHNDEWLCNDKHQCRPSLHSLPFYVSFTNEYIYCECAMYWTGRRCHLSICLHGGWYDDGVGRCHCAHRYGGDHCEEINVWFIVTSAIVIACAAAIVIGIIILFLCPYLRLIRNQQRERTTPRYLRNPATTKPSYIVRRTTPNVKVPSLLNQYQKAGGSSTKYGSSNKTLTSSNNTLGVDYDFDSFTLHDYDTNTEGEIN